MSSDVQHRKEQYELRVEALCWRARRRAARQTQFDPATWTPFLTPDQSKLERVAMMAVLTRPFDKIAARYVKRDWEMQQRLRRAGV